MKCEFIVKDGWIVLDDELGKERCRIWEMMQVTTLGNALWRTDNQRTCFEVPDLGNREATTLGRAVLLIFLD